MSFPKFEGKENYLVERELEPGANGQAYVAIGEKTGRRVLIKTPKFKGVHEKEFFERMEKLQPQLNTERHVLKNLKGLRCVAQTIDNSYFKVGRSKDSENLIFNVYQFIPGITLEKWCELYAQSRGRSPFRGIQEFTIWCKLVTDLLRVVAEVHTRKVVHGDLHAGNVILTGAKEKSFRAGSYGRTVLIDFGWGIVLGDDSLSRADGRNLWRPQWAPERVMHNDSDPRWYAPVDIYSLGYMFLILAVGDLKKDNLSVIPFARPHYHAVPGESGLFSMTNLSADERDSSPIFRPDSEIKDEISRLIADRNPDLYREFPAIAEAIWFCMRPNVALRAKHAGTVLRQLTALVPAAAGKPHFTVRDLQHTSKNLHDLVNKRSKKGVHPMIQRLIHNDLEKLLQSIGSREADFLERIGDRDDQILDLTTCLGDTKPGDKIWGVLSLKLLQSNNLGPTGRIIARLLMCARSGVSVKLVVLVPPTNKGDDDYQPFVREMGKRTLEYQQQGAIQGGDFEVKILAHDDIKYRRFVKEYGSFLTIETGGSFFVMDADFDISGGRCTALRFKALIRNKGEIKTMISLFTNHYNDPMAKAAEDVRL